MELVDRKSLPPAKSRPSRAGRALKKFPHRWEIMVIVLFKGEKGVFPGTPSEGKTKARDPSSCPRARSMNPMVSKMPGGHREVAAIAPQPRRGAPFVGPPRGGARARARTTPAAAPPPPARFPPPGAPPPPPTRKKKQDPPRRSAEPPASPKGPRLPAQQPQE